MTTWVLLKKEVMEHVRTYRLLAVTLVLLAFGLATPLLLVYLPEILELSGEEITIDVPEFTAGDIVKGYLKDLGQIGLLIMVLVSMGSIAQERERGTLEMLLSKPVGAGSVVAAKLLGLSVVLTVGLTGGAAGCYFYTSVLVGAPDVLGYVAANLLAGAYLLVAISVTVLLSAVVKSQIVAGLVALAVVIAGALLGSLAPFEPYVPSSLMGWALDASAQVDEAQWTALAVSAGVVMACAVGAWRALQRQEV